MLRRSSDRTPLGKVVAGIERSYSAGDYEQTAKLLEHDVLGAWFGLEPSRFAEILAVLGAQGFAGAGLLGVLRNILVPASPPSPMDPALADMVAMSMHRLEGRPVASLEHSRGLVERFGALQPIFDVDDGWALLSTVQHGITAMLAGDFSEAKSSFTQARMHVIVPRLAFLTRDACVRSAMLQALLGDLDRARTLLKEATGIPRTESWVEAVLDADQAVVESIVAAESATEALHIVDAVPLRVIGETWPFYVAAVQRALLWAGDLPTARHRLQVFERLPLPRLDGEGFTGSVLLLAGAVTALIGGDLVEARDRLERADQSLVLTGVLTAVLELVAGRPREALQRAVGLSEQTREWRALELCRLAVMAASHLALGAQNECRAVLEYARDLPGGLRGEETWVFSAAVREFAETQIPGWPRPSGSPLPGLDLFPLATEALSTREHEVLEALASGQSREQIASAQFISVNTLKAHLRAIYLKLGVNSRAAAILEAERRGLL